MTPKTGIMADKNLASPIKDTHNNLKYISAEIVILNCYNISLYTLLKDFQKHF